MVGYTCLGFVTFGWLLDVPIIYSRPMEMSPIEYHIMPELVELWLHPMYDSYGVWLLRRVSEFNPTVECLVE
jgi:hypothetical protein